MYGIRIYLHEWLIFIVNVSKYTSPIDPKGDDLENVWEWSTICVDKASHISSWLHDVVYERYVGMGQTWQLPRLWWW